MKKTVENAVERIIRYPADWLQLFMAFIAVVVFRSVIELLLEADHVVLYFGGTIEDFIVYGHLVLSWVCAFSIVGLVLRFFLPIDIKQSFRLLCVLSPIIWVVPFVDLAVTGGVGDEIRYSSNWSDFWFNVIHLFNPFAAIETVSTGVRIEIFLIVLMLLILPVLVFQIKWTRSILMAMSVYFSIFFLGYLPALYRSVYALLGFNLESVAMHATEDYFFMYIPLFLSLCAATFYFLTKDGYANFKLLCWLIYPSRLLFYLLLLIFGYLLTSRQQGVAILGLPSKEIFRIFAAGLSITFLFAYARTINDIYDFDIDRRTNRGRPLAAGELSPNSVSRIGQLFFLFAILFAIPTVPNFIPLWAAVASISYLYSSPPIRLRRFYPVSHLALAGIGCLIYFSGSSLARPEDLYVALVQSNTVLPIFSAFFFLSHLKDLKDIKGDSYGNAQNIFIWMKYKKAASLIFLIFFYISVVHLLKVLDLISTETMILTFVFLAGSSGYVIKLDDLRKIDRLIPISLVLVAMLALFWLFHS